LKANHWRQTAIAAQMLTLPSGMVVKARRPSIEALMVKRRLPDSIAREFLSNAKRGANLEQIAARMEEQGVESSKLIELLRFLVCAALIEPRVVDREVAADDDEQINIDDLPDADLEYLYKWTLNLLPDAKIATVNGNGLTVGAVNNFREGGEGAVTTPGSSDGPEVQQAAI